MPPITYNLHWFLPFLKMQHRHCEIKNFQAWNQVCKHPRSLCIDNGTSFFRNPQDCPKAKARQYNNGIRWRNNDIDSSQRWWVNSREREREGYGVRPQMYASACINHPLHLSPFFLLLARSCLPLYQRCSLKAGTPSIFTDLKFLCLSPPNPRKTSPCSPLHIHTYINTSLWRQEASALGQEGGRG